jgi:hypothetical protein
MMVDLLLDGCTPIQERILFSDCLAADALVKG